MIVKVEVTRPSLNGNKVIWISNEKRTILMERPFTSDVEKRLGGNQKMFFDATFKKGNVTLNHPVKNQNW